MWRLVDYKTVYSNHGCCVDVDDYYKVVNVKTRESKWIDKDDFRYFKRLGLIASNT